MQEKNSSNVSDCAAHRRGKVSGLQAAIARDLLRPPARRKVKACFRCKRSYVNGDADNARFCGTLCREAFDAGAPLDSSWHERLFEVHKWRVVAGGDQGYMPRPMAIRGNGFAVTCAQCGREFGSQGLRCCSLECERKFRQRQELDAELADDPFRTEKRRCQRPGCPHHIPLWKRGRRVSSATRYCSKYCCDEASKARRLAPDSPELISTRETAKKSPKNKGPRRSKKVPPLSREAA
jgi:hypothetical protein